MKTRAFALITAAMLLGALAAGSADDIDNCCFVDRQCNTNLDWINGWHAWQNNQCGAGGGSSAPASSQPASGSPAQIDNCCYVDRQCHSEQDWINGWQARQNNQCGAPAQSSASASTQPTGGASDQIDNCCYVDRQCHSEQDWINGWQAYQNGQCGALGGSPASSSTQPAGGVVLRTASGVVIGDARGRSILPSTRPTRLPGPGQSVSTNNCCQDDWQCNNDQDWAAGYQAFQNNHDNCALPGLVSIVGEPDFVNYYQQMFEVLKNRLPQRYDYALNGLNKIEQRPGHGGGGVISSGRRTFFLRWDRPADEVWSPDGIRANPQYLCTKPAMSIDLMLATA